MRPKISRGIFPAVFLIFFIVSCASTPFINTEQHLVTTKTKQEDLDIYKKNSQIMQRFLYLLYFGHYKVIDLRDVVYDMMRSALKKLDPYSTIFLPGTEADPMSDAYSEECITAEFFADKQIGYIRIRYFYSETDELLEARFKKHIKSLEEKDMKGLIIDLRNNLGGGLWDSCNINGYFLPKDTKIISLQNKDYDPRPVLSASTSNIFYQYPVIILVNNLTASASEILAGVLQHYRVAKLMGQKTYGKGLVLSVMSDKLEAGTDLWLATHKIILPDGRCVEGEGLKPDIELDRETTDSDKIIELAIEELLKKE